MRRCRNCSAPFDGERWQRLCWTCWRKRKDRDAVIAAYDRGYRDGVATARRHSTNEVTPGLLGDLDKHPHERFELANDVTAQLLELRERAA
jgi:hypothetical protein